MKTKKHKGIVNINKLKKITKIKDKYKEKVAAFLEIPQELIGDTTRISIVDNKAIYLEGSNKIEDYYEHYIKIKTKKKMVIVDGKNMVIREMGDNELVIEGNISGISFNG